MTESAPEPTPWVRENLEAIAIAVIMALVLRHFCIEAFKIPTPSMEPTLIGRETRGDRILVNKFAYLISEPKRWDVIVFKYPLNLTKNYIKRLIGLPGETVEIRDGDIFINGKIARKPDEVQDVLWKNWPWFEWREEDNPFFEEWEIDEDSRKDWKLEDGRLAVSATGTTYAKLKKRVRDSYRSLNQHLTSPVSDVRLALEVIPEPGTEEILLSIRANYRTAQLRLGVKGGPTGTEFTFGEESVTKLPALLEPGVPSEIVLCHVDDALILHKDGKQVVRYTYEDDDASLSGRLQKNRNRIRFGLKGGSASFQNVSLHRDIYYTFEARDTWNLKPGGSRNPRWEVPEGKYFALGDNSPQSKDGRYWGLKERVLLSGERRVGDANPRTEVFDADHDPNTFVDRFGESYTLAEIDPAAEVAPEQPMAFIPRRYLMGKAFFVFWPISRSRTDLEAYRVTGPSGDDRSVLNVRFVH